MYDEARVKLVLEAVAGGAPFRRACEEVGIKPGTFSYWVCTDYNGISERFYSALKAKYLLELDDTVALADSVLGSNSLPEVVAAKNAADARRFVAGRIIREFQPHEHQHLQVDHRRTEVHIYLPGKAQPGDRAHVIEGKPRQAIEDRSEADDDEG